ncbi:MAG TPA: hypothetical protein VEA63_10505 [Opitutus sp.]|nr:hypothetical protein [Opitutus sp.]
MALLVILGVALSCFAAGSQAVVFHGLVTNTTAAASANVRLVLTIDGENVSGEMTTEPPLSGAGKLEGRLRGGWCELSGKLNEGFTIQFRGAFNGRDFRGTYVVAVPGEFVQYGKHHLKLHPVAKTMAPAK